MVPDDDTVPDDTTRPVPPDDVPAEPPAPEPPLPPAALPQPVTWAPVGPQPSTWQVSPPASGTPRWLRLGLAAISAVVIVFSALIGALARPGAGGAYASGMVVGGVLTLLVIGLIVRFVVVKARRRGERVLSPWILVAGAAWAIVLLPISLGRFATAIPVDPASRAVIASPYRLEPATAEVSAALDKVITPEFVVREIHSDAEYHGLLIVIPADGSFRWTDWDDEYRKQGESSTPTTVGSAEGRVITDGDNIGLVWLEDGVLTQVLLVHDVASAREFAAAVQAARHAASP